MIQKIISSSIYILLLTGLYGAGGLVLEEFKTGDGCPKISNVPMCLVVLVCFIVAFGTHLLKKWSLLYFICTGFAGGLALVASIMEITGNAECPKTASGTPMCYYSLFLFSSLILLKIIDLRLHKKTHIINN